MNYLKKKKRKFTVITEEENVSGLRKWAKLADRNNCVMGVELNFNL